MTNTIDILLATYNGGKYLREQLDSIIGQNCNDWQLVIRDDGSCDDTLTIINEYIARWPDRIALLDNGGQNVGVVRNFSILLENSTADYIMFCDQDDIWLPHKISATLDKMHEMEQLFDHGTPLLVYTNQTIVDESGSNVLADSVWEYQKLDPRNTSKLNRLLLQNIPTGSTMMINRPLRDLASPVPSEAYMHDWWLALVATTFGKSAYLASPTMLYRQHGNNVIGTGQWNLLDDIRSYIIPARRAVEQSKGKMQLKKYRVQAEAFLDRYCSSLPEPTLRMVYIFAHLDNYNPFIQKYYILRYRFFYSNALVTAAMIALKW